MNRDPRPDNWEFEGRGFNQGQFYSQAHRSRSPRPGNQRDGFRRNFDQRGFRTHQREDGFKDYRQHDCERNEIFRGNLQAREVSRADMFKKKRTEFPEQILYEFRFFASPPKFQNFEQVSKLADPNSDKNEVEEFLSILANN
jgi:hypothetical protein